MNAREIKKDIHWVGAIDWDRRLFDSLIPLPDGTSYNAYLLQGRDETVLFDSVDPGMADVLLSRLEQVPRIDYVVSHHAEQDHSGAIPHVLEKYPEARVIATPKGRDMLEKLLGIAPERFIAVEDGHELSLGNKTLTFIHTPWVHWPETMVTYLKEDRILFSCDFFGSHIATNDLYVKDTGRVFEAAKRYYAEIMMPFRTVIEKNLEKLAPYDIAMIAPSHGQIYPDPALIVNAYRDWVCGEPANAVVLAYISMHGSTRRMVDHFVSALTDRNVRVEQFNLADTDIGKLAMALVDAATVVIGTPTVLTGAHPNAAYAAYLANLLKPKAKFASIIGSYGWYTKAVEQLAGLMPNLKVEILEPVLSKGLPGNDDFSALDRLADRIEEKHRELGLK